MIGHNASEGTEPRNYLLALGQGLCTLEATNAAYDRVSIQYRAGIGVRGRSSNGSYRNLREPYRSQSVSFQQAEETRRRCGGMVVGLTHSRGVVRVMPDEPGKSRALEGISSNTQRDEEASAIL